jgi:uncharacterized membrane protein
MNHQILIYVQKSIIDSNFTMPTESTVYEASKPGNNVPNPTNITQNPTAIKHPKINPLAPILSAIAFVCIVVILICLLMVYCCGGGDELLKFIVKFIGFLISPYGLPLTLASLVAFIFLIVYYFIL